MMRKVERHQVVDLIRTRDNFSRPEISVPRFRAGDRVVIRNITPAGHTRLPRYARGRTGTVQSLRGTYVFPDTNAHALGEHPQHIYSVRFTARDLWGEGYESPDAIYLDLCDAYILESEGDGSND